MKNKIKATVMALLLGVTVTIAQTVDEVINKAIDARGGKEKLANLNAVKMVASIEVAPNMKAPLTMYIVNDKNLRIDIEMQGLTMTQCVEGDSGWAIQPFGGKKEAERMDKEQVQQMGDQKDIRGSLFDYKAKGSTALLLGKEDMEGTDCYKIKLTKKDNVEETYYLDATTYLVLKVTMKHKMKEKDMTADVLFSNYKKIDGLMFAFTMDEREAGAAQGQVINFDSIEVNPKLDKNFFKMPMASSETKAGTGDKK